MVDLCDLACSTDCLDLCPVTQLAHPLLANAVHMFPMIWRFFPTLDTQVDVLTLLSRHEKWKLWRSGFKVAKRSMR